MSQDNFQIVWSGELANTFSTEEATTNSLPNFEQHNTPEQAANGSGLETALICGGIIMAGIVAAKFNSWNARDTVENKAIQKRLSEEASNQ